MFLYFQRPLKQGISKDKHYRTTYILYHIVIDTSSVLQKILDKIFYFVRVVNYLFRGILIAKRFAKSAEGKVQAKFLVEIVIFATSCRGYGLAIT